VRFGSLDFVITKEGELTWVLNGLDTIIEALEELRLDTLGTRIPGHDRSPSISFKALGH
jgi:hypothetical protein